MASLSLIEKGSVATTRDSFKDCIPACNYKSNAYKLREKKVPQAVSGNFTKKWLFCKRDVVYNISSFICGQSS